MKYKTIFWLWKIRQGFREIQPRNQFSELCETILDHNDF